MAASVLMDDTKAARAATGAGVLADCSRPKAARPRKVTDSSHLRTELIDRSQRCKGCDNYLWLRLNRANAVAPKET